MVKQLVFVVMCFMFIGCGSNVDPKNDASDVVGTWKMGDLNDTTYFVFDKNGTGEFLYFNYDNTPYLRYHFLIEWYIDGAFLCYNVVEYIKNTDIVMQEICRVFQVTNSYLLFGSSRFYRTTCLPYFTIN